ncbi:hypothetical protein TSAR_006314 [Trichomalopsis sarcophagae]|uniref:Uncharacterized protein n=1 Tax=Trichomalopsis sarcophagae TaxID=543379 RepID=A0A232FJH1_9HYME|nr:hypothetical protein TSAR_006314 [Trichomalopsis sarcophagae]
MKKRVQFRSAIVAQLLYPNFTRWTTKTGYRIIVLLRTKPRGDYSNCILAKRIYEKKTDPSPLIQVKLSLGTKQLSPELPTTG